MADQTDSPMPDQSNGTETNQSPFEVIYLARPEMADQTNPSIANETIGREANEAEYSAFYQQSPDLVGRPIYVTESGTPRSSTVNRSTSSRGRGYRSNRPTARQSTSIMAHRSNFSTAGLTTLPPGRYRRGSSGGYRPIDPPTDNQNVVSRVNHAIRAARRSGPIIIDRANPNINEWNGSVIDEATVARFRGDNDSMANQPNTSVNGQSNSSAANQSNSSAANQTNLPGTDTWDPQPVVLYFYLGLRVAPRQIYSVERQVNPQGNPSLAAIAARFSVFQFNSGTSINTWMAMLRNGDLGPRRIETFRRLCQIITRLGNTGRAEFSWIDDDRKNVVANWEGLLRDTLIRLTPKPEPSPFRPGANPNAMLPQMIDHEAEEIYAQEMFPREPIPFFFGLHPGTDGYTGNII